MKTLILVYKTNREKLNYLIRNIKSARIKDIFKR